jgi:hypothetical protein
VVLTDEDKESDYKSGVFNVGSDILAGLKAVRRSRDNKLRDDGYVVGEMRLKEVV